MVLTELAAKISKALQGLDKPSIMNGEVLKQCVNEIVTALLQSDVNVHQVKKLRDSILSQCQLQLQQGSDIRNFIKQSVANELIKLLQVEKAPYQPKKGKSNVIMFVGLQGSGKTTTCTKYAHYYQKKGWRTALVCADTFRAGAFDQLKQNSTKVRIPFYGSYSETDPVVISKEGVKKMKDEGFEMIIVDTSGRHKQESELFDEMKQIADVVKPDEIVFIVDGSVGQACYDQAIAFRKAVEVGSVVITKLDGHAKGGGALSAVAATQSPIIFIGTGEHFDDFEEFEADSFVKRLLGLGDLKKIVNIVKEIAPVEDQSRLLEKLLRGNFTLRDMQTQYRGVLKAGSFKQFLSFLPGIGTGLTGNMDDKEGIKKTKKFLCIMDSMTGDELDGIRQMTPQRILRIARGSGNNVEEVMQLLGEFKKLKSTIEGLVKILCKNGINMKDLGDQRNILAKMKPMMGPGLMQQMGSVMNMMKEAENQGKTVGMMGGIQNMIKMLDKK